MKQTKTTTLTLDPKDAVKVPSSLKIFNTIYPIDYSDCKRDGFRGCVHYEKPLIEIDKTISNVQLIRETILHESIHAILEKINHELNDENLVRDLTVGIDSVLSENKDFLNLYQS